MKAVHQLNNLEDLATFCEVAKKRSFSGAAQILHVSPSAVSHRIADLEEELGVRLFSRTTRSVRLTSEGSALFDKVDAGLESIRAGIAELHRPTATPSVTVSCSPSFAIRWLLPKMAEFRSQHEDIEVHVAADDRMADPRREDIDVCIRYGAGKYPGLKVKRLGIERVFPVCNPDFKKRHRLSKSAQLCRLPLIHHDVLRDHPGRVDWPRWLAQAGVAATTAERGVHFSHAHLALTAALAGEGVALGRSSLVEDDLTRGRLVAPFGPRVRSGLAYWLVQPMEQPRAEVEAFTSWLAKKMKRRGK